MSESNQPGHVLHYMDEILEENGGVVRAVLDLCLLMSNQGWRVTLVTSDATDVPPEWLAGAEGCPRTVVMPLPKKSLGDFAPDDAQRLTELIKEADVVHLHTIWDTVNLRVAKHARACGTPYVISTHGMLDHWATNQGKWKKRIYWNLFGRRFFQQAACIHCTAEGEREQVATWCDDSSIVVCPLCFDVTDYQQLPGAELAQSELPVLKNDLPKVLFLSRLHHKKGIDILLRATKLLEDRGMPIELLLAGPGDDDYRILLEQLAVELGIRERTHFLGMVRGESKISLYQACDLFALATHQENFGIVLVEAMACQLPVITTPMVDIWPEIQQGGAKIVDADAKAFADEMQTLLSQPEVAEQLGKQGREFVLEWLDEPRIAGYYDSMYRRAIKGA